MVFDSPGLNSLKAFERTNRDYVVAVLRVSDVELSNFITGFLTRIGDGGSDGNRLACAGFGGALDLRISERSVAQTEAKRK